MPATQVGKKRGRKSSSNKGYWFRTGRGWYLSNGKPLKDGNGCHIKDRQTPAAMLKRAYQTHIVNAKAVEAQPPDSPSPSVMEVCQTYLDHSKQHHNPTTYNQRARLLFDFCTGLPPRFQLTDGRPQPPAHSDADRIHKGYGRMPADKLTIDDIDQWCAAHADWQAAGGCRSGIQAIRAALMHAVRCRRLKSNPIRGVKVAKSRQRITYFTPEQEAALLQHARKPLRDFLRFCIRTGARPSEAAKATVKHVHHEAKGLVIRFEASEVKNKQKRTIYLAGEAADMVKDLLKRHRSGALLRQRNGKGWTQRTLKPAFSRLKKRLKRHGVELDADATTYTCRHTFAKRILGGYWSGKQATIEQLAGLMGNTRQVCWEHYAQWCDAYTDPLWEAVG